MAQRMSGLPILSTTMQITVLIAQAARQQDMCDCEQAKAKHVFGLMQCHAQPAIMGQAGCTHIRL
jgi:hypothetical protein